MILLTLMKIYSIWADKFDNFQNSYISKLKCANAFKWEQKEIDAVKTRC